MTRTHWLIALGILAAVLVGSACVYPQLPARIPMHWNLQGRVDGYGPKTWGVFIMPATMAGLLVLFAVLPSLSPRPFSIDEFRATYGYIVVVILAMMAYIQAAMLFAIARGGVDLMQLMTVGIFVAFALMGNVMGKIRRNFFMGVRVPWTLASERVWNETHRLTAWLMVAAGLVGAGVALAGFPWAAFGLLVPALLVPVVFSLVRYKQLERRGELGTAVMNGEGD